MSSQRRIQSSRANGAKSRGPVTPAGRCNSSRNNLRHGLLAECVVIEDEKTEIFDDILADLACEFNPQTEAQRGLVETMAAARWRLFRIWNIERETLLSEIEKHDHGKRPESRPALAFRALAEQSNILDTLHRYEVRFDRQYARALNLLLKLADPESPLSQFCQTNPVPESDSRIGLPACPGDEVASLTPVQRTPPESPAHAEPTVFPAPVSGVGLPACAGDEVASLTPLQPTPPESPAHAEPTVLPAPVSGVGLPACPGDEVASLTPLQPTPPESLAHAQPTVVPAPVSGVGLPACAGDEVASLTPLQPTPPELPAHAEPTVLPAPVSGVGLPACAGAEVASLTPLQPTPPESPAHAEPTVLPAPVSGVGLSACAGAEVASLTPVQPTRPESPAHAEPTVLPDPQSHNFEVSPQDSLTPLSQVTSPVDNSSPSLLPNHLTENRHVTKLVGAPSAPLTSELEPDGNLYRNGAHKTPRDDK
jgi:hypothetical protein